MPESTISEIESNFPADVREQAYQFLQQWMQQKTSTSVGAVCRALIKEGRRAVAVKVFKLDDKVLGR